MAGSFYIQNHYFSAPALPCALYLVATPIGNLSDITIRALETLAAVDIIACEDTRVTRVLLDAFAIVKKPVSYHQHNAAEMGKSLLMALQEGKSVAVVSDAGTPLISDPGEALVAQAVANGIRVVPIPGASAVLSIVSSSALPLEQFLFFGFLSAKRTTRLQQLQEIAQQKVATVIFEAPHRILASLTDMLAILGEERRVTVGRELTKKYETIQTDNLGKIVRYYQDQARIRGEFVLVIAPNSQQNMEDFDCEQLLNDYMQHMPLARAAAEVAHLTGCKKSDLYKQALHLRDQQKK